MKAKTIQAIAVPYCLILLLLAAGATHAAAQTTAPQREFENENDLRERIDYFYHQRAYPLAHIPDGVRVKALDQLRVMRAAEAAKAAGTPAAATAGIAAATAATPAATPAWTVIGPRRILPAQPYPFWGGPRDSGRVSALAVDPTNSSNVYLGAAEGGLWKSTDGGSTWTPMTDNQPSLAVGSITIDPTNPSIIYVGTGEEDFNSDAYYGAGILKSADGGMTWTQLGASQFAVCSSGAGALASTYSGSYIGSIAVDPANNQVLLAAVQDYCLGSGVYMSTNGGSTWTNVLNMGNLAASSVLFVVNPTPLGATTTAYAALGDSDGGSGNGIYTSTSTNGTTWSAFVPANGTGSNVVPTGTGVGRILLAAAPSNVNTLYAAVAKPDSTFMGIYKTIDGGANWTLTNARDFCSPQCNYNLGIAVSPTNEKVVYATGIYDFNADDPRTVIATTDGGTTWTSLGSGTGKGAAKIHTDGHALAFAADGKRLFVGSDGGAWVTQKADDPTKLDWTDVNDGLYTTQFYPGFSFDSATDAVGGTQDNGTLTRDKTSGEWSNTQCGDGGFTAIDTTTSPVTIYAACNSTQGIYKTPTPVSISSWTQINTGINTADPRLFIPPMVMDPSNPGTLYYGTNQIYQTTNGGSSWASISPQPLPGSSGNVSAIAVAPSNSSVVYAGTTDGTVAAGVNSAGTWTWLNVTGTGLPGRYVTQVRADPSSATTAYVTYSGFFGFATGDTVGHIFKSSSVSATTTWTDISGNLPNIPVNDLVIDPAFGTLYAATDIGVFASTNGGTTWSTFGTGLPNVAVLSLFLEPTGRRLAAATHGRSAWTIPLPKPPKTTASSSAADAHQPTEATALADGPFGKLLSPFQQTSAFWPLETLPF